MEKNEKKENNNKKNNKRKKLLFIISSGVLAVALIILLILLLRACNVPASPVNDETPISEVETYNKLLKIANEKVDALDEEEHKDEKYNVNKLLSFSHKDKNVSYTTYNDNYLVNISFKVSDANDISGSILNDNYSEITTQVLDRYDYSLNTNAYYQSTFVSNSIYYVGRVTPTVNHLSGTYMGNDEKIYSFTNIEFDIDADCPYNENSEELTIYEKDTSNILYLLVKGIVTI